MWVGLALLDSGYLNKADACFKYELKLCREHFANRWVLGQMDQPATFPVTTCHGAFRLLQVSKHIVDCLVHKKKDSQPLNPPTVEEGNGMSSFTPQSVETREDAGFEEIQGRSGRANREERLVMSDS